MVPWGGSEACVLCPKPSTCEGRLALPVSGTESRYLCVEGCRGGSSKILSFLSFVSSSGTGLWVWETHTGLNGTECVWIKTWRSQDSGPSCQEGWPSEAISRADSLNKHLRAEFSMAVTRSGKLLIRRPRGGGQAGPRVQREGPGQGRVMRWPDTFRVW